MRGEDWTSVKSDPSEDYETEEYFDEPVVPAYFAIIVVQYQSSDYRKYDGADVEMGELTEREAVRFIRLFLPNFPVRRILLSIRDSAKRGGMDRLTETDFPDFPEEFGGSAVDILVYGGKR